MQALPLESFTRWPATASEAPRLFSKGEKRSLGLAWSKKLSVLENVPLFSS